VLCVDMEDAGDAGQQKVAAAGHENAEHTKHAVQLRPVLESWSHARFPASRANNGGKLCHFVRHGQGTHNKLAEEIGHSAYQSPQVADARLTALGQQQAAANQEYTATLAGVSVVFVSPLSRAVETALIAFASTAERGVPFIANEDLREQIGRNYCDQRRSVTEVTKDFPQVDFTQLRTEADELWTPERESKASVAQRGHAFMSWLKKRPEKEVAVVCHSSFLLTLFNVVLKCDDTTLEQWFNTGELRSVWVAFP
jgi:broad specificity phosphatase PhoE